MAGGTSRRARQALSTMLLTGATGLALTSPAGAAAEPGQAINNDYGQSDYEVAAEITSQVEGNASVAAARSTYLTYKAKYTYWAGVTATRYKAYRSALASGSSYRIATTKKAWLSARATRDAYRTKRDAAATTLSSLRSKYRAYYTAKHYRPVDGTYTGDVAQYFIGGIGLEPIQVRITVYGGHVSDVEVPLYTDTGSSKYYNDIALPTLMTEAMNAGDTANVAAVSTATLTSEAFAKSLASALVKAGYKL